MTTTTAVNERAYGALRTGAALLERPTHGVLVLADRDRVDFLQRLTTNDIAALHPGQAAVTVLASPVARIEYVFTVLCLDEELWLLPSAGEAEALTGKLRSQIFFMDKVQVVNTDDAFRRFRLMGPAAAQVLAKAELEVPEADDAWAATDGAFVLRQERYDVPGYELIVPEADAGQARDKLVAAGAVLLAEGDAYEARRVELGRPAPGRELTGAYNPLEAGLAWACDDHKGCYTGQEIIARQITYDKVTKTLVGLRSERLLAHGADALAEGRSVGTITSSAYSPAVGGPVALAILRRPHNQVGRIVQVGERPATVAELPLA